MPVQIDTILDAARAHTDEVIKPNVDTWPDFRNSRVSRSVTH